MANLESLISKIKADGDQKVAEILEDAKIEEAKKVDIKKQEAEAQGQILIEKAKRESIIAKDRIISNAKLKVRDEKIQAKQTIITRVFEGAIHTFADMKLDDFLSYIKNNMLSSDIDGDETILLNQKYFKQIPSTFIKELNQELVKVGKKGSLVLQECPESMKDGFILSKKGMQMNFTFEEMVNMYRDELEQEISTQLFGI